MGSFSLLKRIEWIRNTLLFRVLQFYFVGLLSSFQKRGLKEIKKKALSLNSNVESKKDEYNPDERPEESL